MRSMFSHAHTYKKPESFTYAEGGIRGVSIADRLRTMLRRLGKISHLAAEQSKMKVSSRLDMQLGILLTAPFPTGGGSLNAAPRWTIKMIKVDAWPPVCWRMAATCNSHLIGKN